MQHRSPAAATASSGPVAAAASAAMAVPGVGGIEPAVTLDQVPRWSDPDQRLYAPSSSSAAAGGVEAGEGGGSEPAASAFLSFSDPLTGDDGGGVTGGGRGGASRFPVDHEINSRIYLWRGHPWNLEVDAVVNSTNEVAILVLSSCELWRVRIVVLSSVALGILQSLDESHSSPGLHAAAGSGLAEECSTLVRLGNCGDLVQFCGDWGSVICCSVSIFFREDAELGWRR